MQFPRSRVYPPGPGMLLLALPELTDPSFAGSVVYLLECDAEAGSAGVVVNVATRTPVAHVLPTWQDAMSEPEVVFRGGPVQSDGALCLARLALTESVEIPDGVRAVRRSDDGELSGVGIGLVDLDADAAPIQAAVSGLRVFAGHAGWSPGQLEGEIEQGSWVVVPGRAEDVFTSAPGRLWRDVLRRQRGHVALLSSFSTDPGLN